MTNARFALWQGSECCGHLAGRIEHTDTGIRFLAAATKLAVGPAEIHTRDLIFSIRVRSLRTEAALVQVTASCEHTPVLLQSAGEPMAR